MIRRLSTGVAVAVMVSVLAVPSVSALSGNGDPFKGKIGGYSGPPTPEVVCRYDETGRLEDMTIRPLQLRGSYNQLSYVGYQFKIREATDGEMGRLVYKSPIARQLASKTVWSDFARRTFDVTESLDGERAYYVLPVMRFFARGSRTDVEGKATLLYDSYLQKMGNQTFDANACTFEFGQNWDPD